MNGTIRLRDVATGKVRAVLRGHTREVNSVAFSPDGETIVSGSGDNTIRLWKLNPYLNRAPTEKEIKNSEKKFGLTLKKTDMVLAEIPPPNLYGRPYEPPRWSPTHPFYWITKAEAGDAHAMAQLGLCYDRNNENNKALLWYQKAADAGDKFGKGRLAFLTRWLKNHPDMKKRGPEPLSKNSAE